MNSLLARTRFGLLGAPGTLPGGDGPEAVLAQLGAPSALPPADGLPDLAEGLRLMRHRVAELRAAAREQREAQLVTPLQVNIAEAEWRLAVATTTRLPFQERLALHWANHFTVAAGLPMSYLLADMDRTAIRPHMLGRFAALLRACITHPAMLSYLGNDRSFGPNSPEGRRLQRGLNENLARELLELHSLGVDGGYTQQDVIETALILTGWTLPPERAAAEPAAFRPERHEPGARTVLGRRYPEGGAEQLLALLDDLARHPSTARHVTRRLVRHFLGETAPPDLAAGLARVFLDTEGDLRAVTEALVRHPASWTLPPRKLRPPVELVFGVSRMLGGLPPALPLYRTLRSLGQPWRQPGSPAGWPEEDDAWAAPDGVKSRLDWALQLAARRDPALDARALAEANFGPALSAETRQALRRAADGGQALALLVMSPEVQRR
ncbi:MAG: DUF1800 family protein [Roseococcus sp.]|jgi:uncharacterized protein (DUF1800 family)